MFAVLNLCWFEGVLNHKFHHFPSGLRSVPIASLLTGVEVEVEAGRWGVFLENFCVESLYFSVTSSTLNDYENVTSPIFVPSPAAGSLPNKNDISYSVALTGF